jgi:hypothetical protein
MLSFFGWGDDVIVAIMLLLPGLVFRLSTDFIYDIW